ncbi:hypothetical protein [Nocardioides dongkuii]|uniref:hypothetical protein n=1 Tax=Nocardioides dongkuii TaxID=2760089 RepID=UPI0018779945|nr:hypothetical protein [Nocardioides dongkuii]
MRRHVRTVGLLLAAVLATACDADEPDQKADDSPAPGYASLTNLMGNGVLDVEALVVRDALLAAVHTAGGVRVSVTGGQRDTTIDLSTVSTERLGPRRFTWQQDDGTRERIVYPGGRGCLDRASAEDIASMGNTGTGWYEPSGRAYSCLPPGGGSEYLLIHQVRALDPVTRLDRLGGWPELEDLGIEVDDGVRTRHLRVEAVEVGTTDIAFSATYDLWVDEDLRLVRAEYDGLNTAAGPYAATFDYDDPAPVTMPPAAERGPFVLHSGVGPGRRPEMM